MFRLMFLGFLLGTSVFLVACKEKQKVYIGAKAFGDLHPVHLKDVQAFVENKCDTPAAASIPACRYPVVETTSNRCDVDQAVKCDGENAILVCDLRSSKNWFRRKCGDLGTSPGEPVAFWGCASMPSRGQWIECMPVLGHESDYEFVR
jgi:hypothetical protein